MTDMTLFDVLREEREDIPPELDRETINRILTEPEQEALAEAMLADAVDAAPFIGDLLAVQKLEKADERGIEYPKTPVFAQDTLADLPTPLDLISDALIAYHVPHYLQEEYGIEVRQPGTTAIENLAERADDRISPS